MEGDENTTRLNENKLYQNVMKTMMSKVKSVQELIDTFASSLQDQLTALGGISKDVKKILADHKVSVHDVSPSQHDALLEELMEVYVETAIGNKFSVNVKRSGTVQSMKAMIHEKKQFSPSQQTLYYRGKELQDSHTLSECNIFDKSTLHMILDKGFNIRVKMPDGEYWRDILVKKGYTIRDVKTIIKSRTGTPQQMQKLEYDGSHLDDFDTLAECGIAGGYKHIFELSVSWEAILPIEILVVPINSDSRPKYFSVYSSENVINLKRKIEEEEGIDSDDLRLSLSSNRLEDGISHLGQRLGFGGQLLEDYRTFEHYKVEVGSIICYFRLLRGS